MKSTLTSYPVATLVLETGDIFRGYSVGANGTSYGELIFNTSMTGYQEILTDPSYHRQTIVMTYPEIGNYGIHPEESESPKIHAAGLVIKNYYPYQEEGFEYNKRIPLADFLIEQDTIALAGVDTRKITRIIREIGCVKSVITTDDAIQILSDEELINLVKKSKSINDFDCIKEVSTNQPYEYEDTDFNNTHFGTPNHHSSDYSEKIKQIVVLDFGVKKSILHYLKQKTEKITVLPAYSSLEKILSYKPDGILLSNGPGNPATFNNSGIKTIRGLIGKVPLFGICFGHQVLMKSLGEKTYKLKFGHHAANHPVKDLFTNKVAITSQNHGYAVGENQNLKKGLSHRNLNDQTVAGYKDETKACFSVQYHPEAAPGPHDSLDLFNHFFTSIKTFKK